MIANCYFCYVLCLCLLKLPHLRFFYSILFYLKQFSEILRVASVVSAWCTIFLIPWMSVVIGLVSNNNFRLRNHDMMLDCQEWEGQQFLLYFYFFVYTDAWSSSFFHNHFQVIFPTFPLMICVDWVVFKLLNL